MAGPDLSSRATAAPSVGAAASVAALSRSPTAMQPCAHLIHLAEVCNEVAAPLLDAATKRVEVLSYSEPGTRTYADTVAIFDAGAVHAAALKSLEHLCRQMAHDRAFHLFAEAVAAGHGPALLELLRHPGRFADLRRMAEAMDRGMTFVPVEAVSADRLPVPAAVVVVGQDDAPAALGLKARAAAALARLKGRAA